MSYLLLLFIFYFDNVFRFQTVVISTIIPIRKLRWIIKFQLFNLSKEITIHIQLHKLEKDQTLLVKSMISSPNLYLYPEIPTNTWSSYYIATQNPTDIPIKTKNKILSEMVPNAYKLKWLSLFSSKLLKILALNWRRERDFPGKSLE